MIDSQLPSEVQVIELPDGVRYRLPWRRRGHFTLLGWSHVVGGSLGIAFMTFWIGALGLSVFGSPQQANGMELVFLAFGCMMFGMCLWLAVTGLSRVIGHAEIEIRGGELRGLECIGPLHWSWSRPAADVRRLELHDASLDKNGIQAYATPTDATDWNMIVAVWDEPPGEKRLAWGYPRSWLTPLAEDLSWRCGLAEADRTGTIASPACTPVPVTLAPLPNQAGFVDEVEKPEGSKLLVEETPTYLNLRLPGRVEVSVTQDELHVQLRKWLKSELRTWSSDQVAEIRVGREVNEEGPDTPVLLIRPHPGEGQLVRVPLENEAEARWLATRLRAALGLSDAPWDQPGAPFRERAVQPADSDIVREPGPDGVTLHIPAPGFTRGDAPGYLFSAGFTFVLAAGLGGVLFWNGNMGLPILEFIAVVLALLSAASVAAAINQAHRHSLLRVLEDTLFSEETTPFGGTTHRRWHRERIVDVRVGLHVHAVLRSFRQSVIDSGKTPLELQVHLEGGEVVGLLRGRSDEELQWLATVLRRTLGCV